MFLMEWGLLMVNPIRCGLRTVRHCFVGNRGLLVCRFVHGSSGNFIICATRVFEELRIKNRCLFVKFSNAKEIFSFSGFL